MQKLKVNLRSNKRLGFLERKLEQVQSSDLIKLNDQTLTGNADASAATSTPVSIMIPTAFPTGATWAKVTVTITPRLSYTRGAEGGPLVVRSTHQPVLPGQSTFGVSGAYIPDDLNTFTDFRLGSVSVVAYILDPSVTQLEILSTLAKFGESWDADTSAVTYTVDVSSITEFHHSSTPSII